MILPIGKRQESSSGFTQPLRARAGFTLIELVLVILIVSILVALSTPLFKRTFANLQLKNVSFNVAKIISYAREMAIIERVNYRINFDFEKARIWITRLDAPAGGGAEAEGTAPVYKRIGGRYGRFFSFPEGVTIEAGAEGINLYPDGRCNKVEIRIVDESGRGYLLRVRGFGSQVKIEEIEGG